MPTISIVIATFNRASVLRECLQTLARQSFEAGDEIIVVDNGSTDDTGSVLAEARAHAVAPLVALSMPTPGKSHAVSAALDIARGDIVAFTDDDVCVPEEWLTRVREAFRDPDVALAGGPVEPHWEGAPPRWLSLAGHQRLGAPLGLLDYGDAAQRLGARTLLGANLAVRRHILQALGGYNTDLGKLRGTLLSGEDHELCQRVQSAGYGAWYLPALRLAHRVPPSRMRVAYLLRWFFWSGITNAALERTSAPSVERRRLPAYAVKQCAAGAAGALLWAVRGRFTAAVDRLVDSAFAAGYVAARAGLVRTGQPRPRVGGA